jgi:hypothetical protein
MPMELAMRFRISGLSVPQFEPFFTLSDAELDARGARRCRHVPGSRRPCRVSLRYTPPGETAILLAYTHQPAAHSPYRASGPIFVNEAARETFDGIDEVPPVLQLSSALSLRAYDGADMMIDADITPGAEVARVVERLLANDDVAYIHAHFAPRGCYLARIDRA